MKNIKPKIFYAAIGIIVILIIVLIANYNKKDIVVTNFDECVTAGNPIMESYPQQCRYKDQTFTQNIGNELEKMDFIRLDDPRPNQIVISPLNITGEARGYWFFEADFPVILQDSQGNVLAESYATAKGNWMTVDFVDFKSQLLFEKPEDNTGYLILQKDNPSDFEENSDSLKIPVKF
jgi:immunoglobulin-like protein involved in spore germination